MANGVGVLQELCHEVLLHFNLCLFFLPLFAGPVLIFNRGTLIVHANCLSRVIEM